MNYLRPGILFFLQLLSQYCFSQTDNPKFSHLTTNDGLSQNTIFAILKDHKGFMWFATDEGLNKYDGYKFKVYKHDPENPASISNNTIYGLLEDAARNLWIVSTGGLDKFDRAKETFIHYNNYDKGIMFRNIFQDSKGRIWLGSNKGFCWFDESKGTFKFYTNKDTDVNSLSQNFVTKITADSSGDLWIGTRKGLNRFNPETGKFMHYFNDPANNKSIGSDFIKSIYKDSKENIWIGTQGNGIALYNRRDNTFINFKHDPRNKNSICHNDILSFTEDKSGKLWIGTENGGISVFDYSNNKFACYQFDENDPFSISGNSVYSLYRDDIGNIWAGTWSGGINLRPFFGDKFAHFKKIPGNSNSLNNNLVLSIGSDADNNIWIGTDGGGLNRFNPRTHNFISYQNTAAEKSMYSNYVLSVSDYLPGIIALGFHRGGIDLFDTRKEQFTHYAPGEVNAGKLISPSVNIVYKDRQNNLWAGINDNGGVYLFDTKTKGFNVFFPHLKNEKNAGAASIFSMYETKAGQFWIGGNNGLYLFDRSTKEFFNYQHNPNNKQSLSNDAVYSIMEDNTGNLWLGTAGGLNFFDIKTKIFTAYTEKNGLSNNTIWSTQQDKHGNLWIATNKGLSKFDPVTKVFKNYSVTDGLQSYAFKARASYQAPDGEMFFGGVNGFNAFYPDKIKDNNFVPPVRITDFQVFNKPVDIGENTPLKESINQAKEITLDYDHSVFTIEFAALNFNQPERNLYSYKLEGFDKEWINSGNKRTATYTNLNPGTYTFKVKGSNNDGIWNEKATSVKIIIAPPFWLTWWFKTVVLLSVIGSIIGIYKYRMNRIEGQKADLEQKVEEQTWQLLLSAREEKKAREEADTANKAKSAFLATMSHEIRTPMNGVIGMASLLSETRLSTEQQEYTKTISTCGEALLTVINDILDFSKIESGNMELENRSFELRTCIEEVLDVFGEKAGKLGLDLVYEIEDNIPVQIFGDSLRLRQVLVNLVSNAIKFTERGEIFVGVYLAKVKDNGKMELRFEIRDTGIGIAPDKMERLFKAFSQVDSSTSRKYGGTGLGLVISEKIIGLMEGEINVKSKQHEGTTFTFTIIAAAGVSSPPGYVTHPVTAIANKRILVVDDNVTHQRLLKKQLETWQLVPVMAGSGPEALEIMKQQHFDLLLTDMQMPGMDGGELAQQVQQVYPTLPVILVSSVGDERNKKYSGLFKSVLTKPIKQHMLYKLIIEELRGALIHPATAVQPVNQKLSIDFARQHPLKILVAEDNLVNQKLTLKILSKLGFEATLAVNGRVAVQMASLQPYDIVLMDVQMPEVDGLEATKLIRGTIKIQPVIIAMTANAMIEDRKECLDAGMDDFLSKPVKPEEIMNMLAKWYFIIKENSIAIKESA